MDCECRLDNSYVNVNFLVWWVYYSYVKEYPSFPYLEELGIKGFVTKDSERKW